MEREKHIIEGVEMHMVSGGRVVDWNGIKDLANGAMVQVMVNVQGGIGKTGKEEETGVTPGNRMEHLEKGVPRRNNLRSWIRRRSW